MISQVYLKNLEGFLFWAILEYCCSYNNNGNDGDNDLMTDGMYYYVSGCDVDNAYE